MNLKEWFKNLPRGVRTQTRLDLTQHLGLKSPTSVALWIGGLPVPAKHVLKVVEFSLKHTLAIPALPMMTCHEVRPDIYVNRCTCKKECLLLKLKEGENDAISN